MAKAAAFILKTFLLLILLVTIASFFGAYNFICEFLSHARPLLCLSALLATFFLVFVRARRAATFSLFLTLVNLVQLVSLSLPFEHEAKAGDPQIKFLQMNIWGGRNRQVEAVLKEIEKENADLVGISEINSNWWSILKPKSKSYPYQVVEPSFGGICLLSKFPFQDARIEHFGSLKRPRVVAHVRIDGQTVKIIFAHPVIPMRHIGMRDGELAELAKDAADTSQPVILAGDLNCTPWSYFFYKLERDGSLQDTEKGFGYQPTWNAFFFFPLFCIDHCLVSDHFTTLKRYNGPKVGSDHLPVITELSLKPTKRVSLAPQFEKKDGNR